jgi:hypothetical protein
MGPGYPLRVTGPIRLYFSPPFLIEINAGTHTQGQERLELAHLECDPPAPPSPARLPTSPKRRPRDTY